MSFAPTLFRRLVTAATLLVFTAAPALAQEPVAEEPVTEVPNREPIEASPTTSPDAEEGVRLVPVPVPDFDVYEPAVADQLREVQAALTVLLNRAAGEEPPSPAELAASFGDVGRHYHAYGLLDSAAASYANAALLAPQDPRWPHLLGRARQQAGELDQAVEAYQRALELAPDDVPALIYLAEIRVLQGDAAEAQSLYRRALALEPTASAALAGLGEAALEAGQPARAVELLEAALEANPAADRLHHPLGLAYRALGNREEARRHLEAAGTVGIRTDDPLVADLEELKSGERVHLLRGHMAFRAGHFGEAADAYHRATEAAPESVTAQVDLATALSRIGYLEGAEDHLREALALDPENANVHYNLGALLVAAGEPRGAELHLRRAVTLDPEDAAALTTLAGLVGAQDPAAAIDLYRRAQALPDAGEEAYLGEIRVALAHGRFPQALDRAEAGFEAVPSSVNLLGTLARMLAAGPQDDLRDGARALNLAERYFAAGQSLASGEVYALALAESGRCEEAAEWQQQLIDVASNNGAENLVPSYRADLERYRSGPPCRPPLAEAGATAGTGGTSTQ